MGNKLPSAPTPERFAKALTELLGPIGEKAAGDDARLTKTEVKKAADRGRVTVEESELATETLLKELRRSKKERPGVAGVIEGIGRRALRAGKKADGGDGRISGPDASSGLPKDLVKLFAHLRGAQVTAPPSPAPSSTDPRTTLKGTWLLDLDTGKQSDVGDIWWEQMTNTDRRLTPMSGAEIAHLGKVDFDSLSLADLKAASFSSEPIVGDIGAGNKLKKDTVVAIKTSDGRYAKLIVEKYGYDMDVRFVTYNANGTKRKIEPKLVEPTPPEAPPPEPPAGPTSHFVAPDPAPLENATALALPAGVPSRIAAAGQVGDSNWVARRISVTPSELLALESDPPLLHTFVRNLAFRGEEAPGVSVGTAPITIGEAPEGLGKGIVGWDDWSEAQRDAIRAAVSNIAEKLLPDGFVGDPAVRLRVMSAGDEDNTWNVAGLVAWNLETGEARGLFAHHIW